MRKLFIPLCCMLLGLSMQSMAQGKFKFDSGEVHDFGVVERGPLAYHKFEFTNVGNAPIIVQDVTPSCGCTNVDWSRNPVLPNQKGFIQLSLKTDEQHGVFNKEVYIRSTAIVPNGEKRYTLYIKGNAVDPDKKKK